MEKRFKVAKSGNIYFLDYNKTVDIILLQNVHKLLEYHSDDWCCAYLKSLDSDRFLELFEEAIVECFLYVDTAEVIE